MSSSRATSFATPYFDSLFDDFSIWQHADGTKPLPEHGYALDDATRGLLVCLALGKTRQAHVLFDYIEMSRRGLEFYGFYDANRQPMQFPASDDAKGQVIWAMGYAASRDFEKARALKLIEHVAPALITMPNMRGIAYALLGALYTERSLAQELNKNLLQRLAHVTDDWPWPEGKLTYANGLMPYAFLRYALMLHDKTAEAWGRKTLNFVEKYSTEGRMRGPIGYEGWFKRGDKKPAEDGQQAIDTAYMIMAWMAAYQLSSDPADLEKANAWWQWLEGENIARKRMYDPVTLKAYDGIHLHTTNHHTEEGINYHSGAESNICLLLSKWVLATRQTI